MNPWHETSCITLAEQTVSMLPSYWYRTWSSLRTSECQKVHYDIVGFNLSIRQIKYLPLHGNRWKHEQRNQVISTWSFKTPLLSQDDIFFVLDVLSTQGVCMLCSLSQQRHWSLMRLRNLNSCTEKIRANIWMTSAERDACTPTSQISRRIGECSNLI